MNAPRFQLRVIARHTPEHTNEQRIAALRDREFKVERLDGNWIITRPE